MNIIQHIIRIESFTFYISLLILLLISLFYSFFLAYHVSLDCLGKIQTRGALYNAKKSIVLYQMFFNFFSDASLPLAEMGIYGDNLSAIIYYRLSLSL